MSAAFASLLPVALLIALGFMLKRYSVVPEEMWRGVELLGYWVFFPSLLTLTMIKADLASISITAVSAVMVASSATMSLVLIGLRRHWNRLLATADEGFTSLYQSSVRWNGFVALPIAVELYGNLGATTVAIIMAWLVPMANASAVAVLARYASGSTPPSPARTIYIVFRNPFIWATFIGMGINLGGLSLPVPLSATMNMLGGAAIATGLLMVGAGLRLADTIPPSRAALAGTALKLLGMPALVFIFATIFGLNGITFIVAVICAGVPTAMNGYVLARQMGGDANLQAAATTLQTVICFFTIPLLIWLAQAYTG